MKNLLIAAAITLSIAADTCDDPFPDEPPPPPGTYSHIAPVGCSQTAAVLGYRRVDGTVLGYRQLYSPDIFNSAKKYNGGTIDKWARSINETLNKDYFDLMISRITGQEDAVWWQLCAIGSVSWSKTLDVYNEIQRVAPGVPIYVSPLDVSKVSSPDCGLNVNRDQTVSYADRLVSEGKALPGPVLWPPYGPSEVVGDGCHPNAAGAARHAQLLHEFFAGG